jgi:hypothetical protein
MSVILGRLSLGLVVLAATTLGCGGSSNGGLQALCAKSCQKLVACLPELGTEAQCEAACNSASGTTCPNLAAITAGLNQCLAMTSCTDFEPCFVAVPHCASTDGGADTAGSSGGAAGSPGGFAGTVGTGSAGHTGSAGTGGGTAGSSGGGGTAGGLGTGGAGSGGAASAFSVVTVSNQYGGGTSTSYVSASFATAAGMASAGTVTVTGTTSPISMTPTSPGIYNSGFLSPPLFATGDTLVLSATGGDVPAFSNVKVVAAAGVVVTAPVAVANSYMIDTTADLPLAWTGGETGVPVSFTFQGSDSNNNPIDVVVSFDSTIHAGIVPKGMLSKLVGTKFGLLLAQTYTQTQFDDGMVTSIYFYAASDYEGNAVFQ